MYSVVKANEVGNTHAFQMATVKIFAHQAIPWFNRLKYIRP